MFLLCILSLSLSNKWLKNYKFVAVKNKLVALEGKNRKPALVIHHLLDSVDSLQNNALFFNIWIILSSSVITSFSLMCLVFL